MLTRPPGPETCFSASLSEPLCSERAAGTERGPRASGWARIPPGPLRPGRAPSPGPPLEESHPSPSRRGCGSYLCGGRGSAGARRGLDSGGGRREAGGGRRDAGGGSACSCGRGMLRGCLAATASSAPGHPPAGRPPARPRWAPGQGLCCVEGTPWDRVLADSPRTPAPPWGSPPHTCVCPAASEPPHQEPRSQSQAEQDGESSQKTLRNTLPVLWENKGGCD